MAKPRIFVSSTYYDLKYIRNNLQSFISSFGYEPILFENGDIPFHHTEPLDESCYQEIDNAHIFVLIIGGRYGSVSSEDKIHMSTEKALFYNSITSKEYESAKAKDIPIYIFVEKNVLSEYRTYTKNKDNTSITYAHVDNINIFKLLDTIYHANRNNYVKEFENFNDISNWLKEQWAGLFADFLVKKSDSTHMLRISSQVENLENVVLVLKDYTENILKSLEPQHSTEIIKLQDTKLESKRINQITRNPLIKFLLRRLIERKTFAPITKEILFSLFNKSDSFQHFIELIMKKYKFTEGMNNLGITALIDNPAAKNDYYELKGIDFDEPEEVCQG